MNILLLFLTISASAKINIASINILKKLLPNIEAFGQGYLIGSCLTPPIHVSPAIFLYPVVT